MSQLAAAGYQEALRRTLSLGIKSVLFLMLPVCAALTLFSTPVVRLLFERGEFDPSATVVVAACLAAYAVGLIPMAAYYVVTRTYYALHNMRTPVATGAGMVGLNALLAYAFMRAWGVAGIALATTIVSFINMGLLLWLLRRSLGPLGGRNILSGALRIALVTALAMVVWSLVMRVAGGALPNGRLSDVLVLAAAAGSAAVTYLAGCLLLRVEGISFLRALIRRPS
jgi:putative peptidoglycan lipid II flippase